MGNTYPIENERTSLPSIFVGAQDVLLHGKSNQKVNCPKQGLTA